MRKYLPLTIVLLVVAVLAFSFGAWKRRQEILQVDREKHQIEQQVESGELTQQEADALLNESVGGSNENPVTDESAASTEASQAEQVLKEVKRSSSAVEGTEAIKITNAFYMAYNQRSFSAMATLFAPSTAGGGNFEKVLNEAVADNSVRPISFEFENVEVRGDSSVLVTAKEVRADNEGNKSTTRRLLELIPVDGQHKILSYFKPDSTDTLSGFDN